MGREEIRRLCLNVWASPAVSPGGRAGCSDRHGIPFRYVPLPTRFHPAGCMSRAGARLYPLTAFVHLPYSPTITRAISAGRKCHMVNMRPAGVRGPDRRIIPGSVSVSVSGGPIRSHPINIAESPEYGRPPPVGWSPNRVRSGRLPIRSHPINPIRSSPAGGVRELHGSGRCTLPFRGGNIEGRPAGGGPGFFRDGRHVSG